MSVIKRLSTRAVLGAAIAGLPGVAAATDTTIPNGTTVTTTTAVTGTDTVTVEEGGAIAVTGGAPGIRWDGNSTGPTGVTITNSGSITAQNGGAIGINLATMHHGVFRVFNTGGTISSVTGPAIFMGSPNIPTNYSDGPVIIANVDGGIISGGLVIPAAGPNPFAIMTGTGEDLLVYSTDAQINGRVFVGDGSDYDTLVLIDSPTDHVGHFFGESDGDFAGWDGFDIVTVAGGTWTLHGGGYYEEVNIDTGASLILDQTNAFGAVDCCLGPGNISGSTVLTVDGSLTLQGTSDSNYVYSVPGDGTSWSLHGGGDVNIENAGTFALHSTGNTFTGDLNLSNGGRFVLTGDFAGNVHLGENGVMVLGASFTSAGEDDGGAPIYNISGPGASGTMTGDIEVGAGGHVVFNRTNSFTYSGALSGGGALYKAGGGVLTLDGAYTFTGETRVFGGSIVVVSQLPTTTVVTVDNGAALDISGTSQTVSGLAGTGGEINVDSGEITVDSTAASTFGGEITGAGAVTLSGGGSLNLTAANTYTGPTTVEEGQLYVNGSITSDVSVEDGGKLSGAGDIVGNVEIAAGGAAAPGNSPGVLEVAGDFTFQTGSTYEIETLPDGASDRIVVTGGALTIEAGSTAAVLAGGTTYSLQTEYTVATATDGVSGTFDTVTSNLAFLDPTLTYGANSITLTLTRNDVAFADLAETENQAGVGSAVQTMDGGDPVFLAVLNADVDGAADAFDALSGEAHASVQSVGLNGSNALFGQLSDRLDGLAQGPQFVQVASLSTDAGAPGQPESNLWGEIFGSAGSLDGDAGTAGVDFERSGLSVGFDGAPGVNSRLGVAAGYHRGDLDIADRASQADVEAFDLAVYGGARAGGLVLRGSVGYSTRTIETDRDVVVGLLTEHLEAEYDATALSIEGEVSHPVQGDKVRFEPFLGVAYISLDTDGFTESGGSSALTGAEAESSVTFATLGVRAAHNYAGGSLFGTLAWRNASGDIAPETDMAFASDPGASFTVACAPIAENAAIVEAGVSFDVGGAQLSASYRGEIADDAEDHGGRVRLRWAF